MRSERDRRAWSVGWGTALIAALLLALSTGCSVRAVDPLGIETAVEETRLAVDRMTGALMGLPPAARDEVAGEVRLAAEAVHRALDRIAMQPVPIADSELTHDLWFVTDVAHAITAELQSATEQDAGQAGGALLGRLDRLLGAADARVDQIDARIDRWGERTQGAVTDIESSRGVLVVRRIDRMAQDAVRYVGVGLLLVGVLAVGLRLLRMSEERSDSFTLFADRPGVSSVAILALGMFFVASLLLSISPGTLAALSAEVERQPPEHPCHRLDQQRSQLAAAKLIGHAGLIDAVKQRMVQPARDCLGMASESLAAEAVERLAGRTGEFPAMPMTETGRRAAGPGSAPDRLASDGAALDRLVATLERIDRAIRQQAIAAERRASESTGSASSAQPRSDGPPKPALRAAPPREGVTTTRVNYRSAPQRDASRLGTLARGTRVTVLDDANGWTEVRLRDGRKAFVASRFLQPAR